MPTTKEMKTLTIDGQTYEIVDETARENIPNIQVLEWDSSDFTINTTNFKGDSYIWGKTFVFLNHYLTVINVSLVCNHVYNWGTSYNIATPSSELLSYINGLGGHGTVTFTGPMSSGSAVGRISFDASKSNSIVMALSGDVSSYNNQYISGQIIIS